MFIYFIYYNVWLNYSISRTSNFLKLDQLIEVSPPDYLLGWGHVSQQFTQKMNAYMIWHVYIYIYRDIYIHWYSTCLCVYVNQECMFRCTNKPDPCYVKVTGFPWRTERTVFEFENATHLLKCSFTMRKIFAVCRVWRTRRSANEEKAAILNKVQTLPPKSVMAAQIRRW